MAPDAGSIKYRIPAHVEYFKQSVAHNVLVVDGQSQERTPPPDLRGFVAGQTLQMVRAATGKAYPGVNLERTLLLTDDYLVDIFQARSDTAHTYDWVYHNWGQFASADLTFEPAAQPPAEINGYEYLQNVQATEPWSGGLWQAEWTLDPNRHVRGIFAGQPGDRTFLAEGLIAADKGDEIADDTVPVLIVRRQGTGTRFVSILEPYRSGPAINSVAPLMLTDAAGQPVELENGEALELQRDGGRDLLVLDDAGQVKQVGNLQTDARQLWASFDQGRLRALYVGMGAQASGPGWVMRLEGLSTAADIDDVNVLLEFPDGERLRVHNSGVRSVGLELEGLTSAGARIWQLNRAGQRAQEIRPTRVEDGFLRFVLAPQTGYE
ncbi:MAG: hypothetical protein D6790_13990, partial [Caldilineae bacterium]